MPSSVTIEVAGAHIGLDVVKGSEVDQLLAYLNQSTPGTQPLEHCQLMSSVSAAIERRRS